MSRSKNTPFTVGEWVESIFSGSENSVGEGILRQLSDFQKGCQMTRVMTDTSKRTKHLFISGAGISGGVAAEFTFEFSYQPSPHTLADTIREGREVLAAYRKNGGFL